MSIVEMPLIPARQQAKPLGRSGRRQWIPAIRQAALAFVIAIALLAINDLFFFESVLIPTSSMRPTILPNERVLLRKILFHPVRRFDPVVIHSHKTGLRIAKRIIGLPGERIRIEQGWRVLVNDQPLAYSEEDSEHRRNEGNDHQIELAAQSTLPTDTKEFQLRSNEYFVLGDNRLASEDSRVIGPIPAAEIEGKLTLAWYSYDLEQARWRNGRWMRFIR